jgi:sporulation protein YqfC
MGERLRKYTIAAAKLLDFPYDVVMDVPKITITGDLTVHIENHRGIVEYMPDKIRINSKLGLIHIYGTEMMIKEIIPERILIEGNIKRFELGL